MLFLCFLFKLLFLIILPQYLEELNWQGLVYWYSFSRNFTLLLMIMSICFFWGDDKHVWMTFWVLSCVQLESEITTLLVTTYNFFVSVTFWEISWILIWIFFYMANNGKSGLNYSLSLALTITILSDINFETLSIIFNWYQMVNGISLFLSDLLLCLLRVSIVVGIRDLICVMKILLSEMR